ncbi:MAG: PilZ domain-containing protein [Candidatus Latescibacteria bacterium]|nr:PilZ domain-containing protein [Candidatus Latescibacterota bacterium]
MDHRSNTRVAFKMGVEITAGSYRSFSVETRDLSLGGLQVDSENRLPEKTECDVTLHPAAGLGLATFSIKATVVRHTETGMGMAFFHPSSEKLLRLCDLLIAAGQEEVIQREIGKLAPDVIPKATEGTKDIFMM